MQHYLLDTPHFITWNVATTLTSRCRFLSTRMDICSYGFKCHMHMQLKSLGGAFELDLHLVMSTVFTPGPWKYPIISWIGPCFACYASNEDVMPDWVCNLSNYIGRVCPWTCMLSNDVVCMYHTLYRPHVHTSDVGYVNNEGPARELSRANQNLCWSDGEKCKFIPQHNPLDNRWSLCELN
jgi:hypothetical protein